MVHEINSDDEEVKPPFRVGAMWALFQAIGIALLVAWIPFGIEAGVDWKSPILVGCGARLGLLVPAAIALCIRWEFVEESGWIIFFEAIGSCCVLLAPAAVAMEKHVPAQYNTIQLSIMASLVGFSFVCYTIIGIIGINHFLLQPLAAGIHQSAYEAAASVRQDAYKAGAVIRCVSLHPALVARGYDWMTHAQARRLWELNGEAAFRLPPWDEVAVLPGVTQGDIEALADLIQKVQP